MDTPNIRRSGLKFISLAFFAAVMMIGASSAFAQKTDANESASLEQCRNGSSALPDACDESGGGSGWVPGNTGSSNSHWKETDYLPYRMTFLNLSTSGTTTVTIGYDVLKGGVHAIDYLGTYDLTETVAMGNNPCDGVIGAHCASYPAGSTSILIPVDPELNNTGVPAPAPVTMPATGQFRMWGGTLQSITYEPYLGGEERRITLTFNATVSNPVLAWAGHVGWQGEWGAGNSAGGISGSPYHMRLISLNGSGGNQDRSLSADAVAIPPKVTIIKSVTALGGATAYPLPFDFDASSAFGFTDFDLTDNNVVGPDRQESTAINLGVNPSITINITENNRIGWTLDSIVCVGSAHTAVRVGDGVDLTLTDGDTVTCTFNNQQLAPSAAPASVNGRVATANGRGIGGATVTIYNVTTGQSFTRVTSTFGYYSFADLPVSDFYLMTVMHKRYVFLDGSRSFTLDEDMFGVDFTAAIEE